MDLLYLIFPLFYYFTNNYLIVSLMAIDNIFISVNTICKIYNYQMIDFYEKPYYDRYIYYFVISFLNPIIYLILYVDISLLLLITTIPPIFKIILLNNHYIESIKYYMHKIKKHIIYDLINYFLKLICQTTLKLNPCFTKKEIANLYKENYKEHVLLLIKNIILLTVIKAISDGSTISLSIIKKIYNTKAVHQYTDPFPDIDNHVEKIKEIVMKRNFKLLFNPYVLDIFTKLYEQEQVSAIIPKVNSFFNDLELCTAKMLAVVTLSKLWSFDHYIMIGLISLTLSPFTLKNLMIKIVGTLISYLSNYYLGCIVCEYGDLLFSQIFSWLCEKLIKLYNNNNHLVTHCNKYNDIILFNAAYLYLLSYYNININIKILFYCYLIVNAKYPFMTSYFILAGYMSNYNLSHLCLLSITLYLFINLYYFKSAPLPKIPLTLIPNYTQNINIVKNYMNVDIVEDYDHTKNKKDNIKDNNKNKIIDDINKDKIIDNIGKDALHKPKIYYDNRLHVLNSMHNPKYIIPPI